MRGLSVVASLCVVLGVASGLLAQDTPTKRPTGLKLASREQLLGVPPALLPYSGQELPASADLSQNLPPPGDQGMLNSCVGWAVGYALKSYQEKVEEGQPLTRSDGQIEPRRVFSPAFIYNQINNGQDGGSYFQDALNLLTEHGAAPWAEMPYDSSDFKRQPSDAARQSATRYRIQLWRQVNTSDTREIKTQLAAGYPVIAGVRTDTSFNEARRGFVWSKTAGESQGGHAILVVGYDDSKRAFKLINSWSTQWGDGGYGWIDYDHFRTVGNEAYVAKDAMNGPPPSTPTPPPPPPTTPIPTPPPVIADASTPVPTPPPTPPPVVATPTPRPLAVPPQFTITNINYNATIPNNPASGYWLRFDGNLFIPPGSGRTDQIVIHFYFNAGNGTKGAPVRSRIAQYASVYGQAACGTAVYPVPPEGIVARTTWGAWIPYAAFEVPQGQWVQSAYGPVYQPAMSYLIAEPVLFIDNFGVASGGLYPFSVSF